MLKITDMRSKLIDGLLASGMLILLELVLILLIRPVELLFGRPGMLIFTVSVLALSGFCLDQALSERFSEWARACWGVVGGIAAWITVELSTRLGNQTLTSETGMLMLMLVILVITITWRRVAPLGLRYFFVLVLMGWISHIALKGIAFLAVFDPFFRNIPTLLGYLSVALLTVTLLYNFLRTRSRLERINAAIIAWLAVMIMIEVFRGSLI